MLRGQAGSKQQPVPRGGEGQRCGALGCSEGEEQPGGSLSVQPEHGKVRGHDVHAFQGGKLKAETLFPVFAAECCVTGAGECFLAALGPI